jgi:hypothetical protein
LSNLPKLLSGLDSKSLSLGLSSCRGALQLSFTSTITIKYGPINKAYLGDLRRQAPDTIC